MSQDVFQMIQNMGLNHLEMQLALQCAPLLTGLKISNLLIVQNVHVQYVEEMFQKTEIKCLVLCVTNEKTIFLLYKQEELSEYIESKEVKGLLKVLGYQKSSLQQIFVTVRKRYETFIEDRILFPHELGLLLGYPVEDVHGFIVNQGENFIYAGYWKVYGNLLEKLRLFEEYNQAKESVIRFVFYGAEIMEIMEFYHDSKRN